jgi:hypothetical protein
MSLRRRSSSKRSKNLFVGGRREIVLNDDLVPDTRLVAHRRLQPERQRCGDLELEIVGELGPHLAPAEQVAVVDVERLIGRAGVGRGPDGGPGEQSRVSHLATYYQRDADRIAALPDLVRSAI